MSETGHEWRFPWWVHHSSCPLVHTVSSAITEITAYVCAAAV
jgi:hypothetical protein